MGKRHCHRQATGRVEQEPEEFVLGAIHPDYPQAEDEQQHDEID